MAGNIWEQHTREAPAPSPKIISVSCAKNEPKTSPFVPACFDYDNLSRSLSLSVMLMKEVLCSPKPAIEAHRGSARPGRGHASDAKRSGTRTKRGLSSRAELKVVGNCAASLKF